MSNKKQTAVDWLVYELDLTLCDFTKRKLEQAKELETKQKDDYAIEFAEWLRQKTAQVKGNRYKLFSDFEIYTLKELLETFKKEKGL